MTPLDTPHREAYTYEPPDDLFDEYPHVGASSAYDPTKFDEGHPKQGAGWPTASSRPRIEDADAVVIDRDSLVTALNSADEGDLIFIAPWAAIDLTGVHGQDVGAPNVTLASDLGPASEGGALVVTDSMPMQKKSVRRVFNITKPGFRATSFRLLGPQTTHNEWKDYETNRPMSGLELNAGYCEVDNLVGRGWGHCPVNVGRHGFVEKVHIHHCDLVDNPQDALGYGVATRHAAPLIQYCYFDNNRHSIAGSGHEDCSFIARYNVLGPRGILHAIDMHSHSSADGTRTQGGKRVSIHHNTVLFRENRVNSQPQEAVKLRDVPLEGGQILDNRFHHPRDRFDERHSGRNGDALLLTTPAERESPETFEEVNIDVRGNYSAPGRLADNLGPPPLDSPTAPEPPVERGP